MFLAVNARRDGNAFVVIPDIKIDLGLDQPVFFKGKGVSAIFGIFNVALYRIQPVVSRMRVIAVDGFEEKRVPVSDGASILKFDKGIVV